MPRLLTKRSCEHCKKRYEPRTSWQKYCSQRCQLREWRKDRVWVKLPGKAK